MLKRGSLVQKTIIGFIIVILAAAILIAVNSKLHEGLKSPIDRQACKDSVNIRSNLFLNGEWGIEAPLRCQTEEVIIQTTNQEEIKKILADQMYFCWDTLGMGTKTIFKRDPTVAEFQRHCIICSTIQFKENVREKIPELTGLDKYLEEKNVPLQKITYWKFLTNSNTPVIAREEGDSRGLRTDLDYAVIYLEADRSTLKNSIAGGGCAFGGLLAGAGIGAAIGSIVPIAGTAVGGVAGAGIGLALGAAGAIGCSAIEDKWMDYLQQDENIAGGIYRGLMMIPMNSESMNAYGCQNIESIP